MLMTTSAPAMAPPRSDAADAPAAAARSRAALTVSNARTAWPAATRLRAIGRPMFPSPMKPMLAMSFSRILCREFEAGLARRLEIAPDQIVGYLGQRRRLP